jgi:hypothetical protein
MGVKTRMGAHDVVRPVRDFNLGRKYRRVLMLPDVPLPLSFCKPLDCNYLTHYHEFY